MQPQVLSLDSKEETNSYLVVHKELWSFEVPRGHTDVVFLSWMVEFGQTPVYEPQLNMQERHNHQSGGEATLPKPQSLDASGAQGGGMPSVNSRCSQQFSDQVFPFPLTSAGGAKPSLESSTPF